MRDKGSLHSVPIGPNPNFAGDLRGYRQQRDDSNRPIRASFRSIPEPKQ
jgi:hypothetical protein